MSRVCQLSYCASKHHSKGYCSKHAENFRRYGYIAEVTQDARPAIIRPDRALLPLGVGAKDGYTTVDIDSAILSRYKWHFDGRYAATRINDRKIRLHHMILPRKLGLDVDHINGDSLDNRSVNLRYLTHADNIRNQNRTRSRVPV